MALALQTTDPHIRPIRLRRDLAEVTNLVELCFSDHMDLEGRTYLQNIRRVGRDGDPYYLDATSPETSPLPFHGYIWVENNRIVGNVTLIYMKKNGQNLYFVANVSVDPEYRGHGIARMLTRRAMRHAQEHNGHSVTLQVREDNQIAISLYESLGFVEYTRRTNWGIQKRPPNLTNLTTPAIKIAPRQTENWSQQREWLNQLYPEKVSWFLPYQLSKQEPGFFNDFSRWLNGDSLHFWQATQAEKLIGLATLENINLLQDYLWIATSPAYEEIAIPALVSKIARRSLHPLRIQVNYPAHRAVAAFQALGMKEINTLIWMEYTIPPVLPQ
jgi:ribosomal protein S18 acetylase RimI-like enzyme